MINQDSLAATCSLADAESRRWDVLVVGAGPAGSIAARQLAAGGSTVLLVDKAEFPRRKVCGCYLNGSAMATLQGVGLGSLCRRLGAPTITGIRMGTRGRVAERVVGVGEGSLQGFPGFHGFEGHAVFSSRRTGVVDLRAQS